MLFELLPFKIFHHCFYCSPGSKSLSKCRWCVRFFVNDSDLANDLEKWFKFSMDEFKYTDL